MQPMAGCRYPANRGVPGPRSSPIPAPGRGTGCVPRNWFPQRAGNCGRPPRSASVRRHDRRDHARHRSDRRSISAALTASSPPSRVPRSIEAAAPAARPERVPARTAVPDSGDRLHYARRGTARQRGRPDRPSHTGERAADATAEHGIALQVVKLPEAKRGVVLLPRRWVVERSFAWATRFRRLVKDHERHAQTPAGLHAVAFACLIMKQAAALATGA